MTTTTAPLAPTQNLNVVNLRPIVTPAALTAELPVSPAAHATVTEGRKAIRDVLAGRDKRLLVVIGPCSVHDPEAAVEYAEKLVAIRPKVEDQFLLVMRVYFEKPRTTVGWKGLINDPHLDGTFDINSGLRIARKLLLKVNEIGLPTATEFLDQIVPQYIDDLVGWAAIGARTTESQTHRQMASGLSMPVGFKNSTDGSIQIAIDAMKAAQSGHHFLGIDEDGRAVIVQTRGNDAGHIILRGGQGRPNYSQDNVADAAAALAKAGLPAKLMVDCSHANSNKKHENQIVVWQSVVDQRLVAAPPSPVMGVMVESNLNDGRQDVPPAGPSVLKHGVSITDACIGWETTECLLLDGADRLRQGNG